MFDLIIIWGVVRRVRGFKYQNTKKLPGDREHNTMETVSIGYGKSMHTHICRKFES